jgi:hypothetical protein
MSRRADELQTAGDLAESRALREASLRLAAVRARQ